VIGVERNQGIFALEKDVGEGSGSTLSNGRSAKTPAGGRYKKRERACVREGACLR